MHIIWKTEKEKNQCSGQTHNRSFAVKSKITSSQQLQMFCENVIVFVPEAQNLYKPINYEAAFQPLMQVSKWKVSWGLVPFSFFHSNCRYPIAGCKPTNTGWATGQLPLPRFSKSSLVSRHNTNYNHFEPPLRNSAITSYNNFGLTENISWLRAC